MPATPDAFLMRAAKRLACVVALGVHAAIPALAQPSSDPTSGTALYEDVRRYDGFGVHRYGTAGLDAALDWMAARLRAAGFVVEEQAFAVGRQYFLEAASLQVGGETLEVLPQWWLPEGAASFSLSAPLAGDARDGPAEGRFVRLRIPYDEGAYLGKNQRAAVAQAMRRHPAAVLLTIDHPSGELFAYNVSQADEPWPVPVILVAPKDEAKLAAAEATGEPLTLSVRGRYERNVPGRNVIGRLDRGKARTVVVSTPVSSWFTSTCERGPGIAAFLATAAVASRSMTDVNFVFVATSGHEVGHGGMEHFIHDKAPPPKDTAAWLHYGASLACYARPVTGAGSAPRPAVNGASRYLLMSSGLEARVEPAFRDLATNRLAGENANVGELREIMGAGYTRAFGMAGLHPLFHTSRDSAEMTSPALLEPVVQDFVRALRAVAESQ